MSEVRGYQERYQKWAEQRQLSPEEEAYYNLPPDERRAGYTNLTSQQTEAFRQHRYVLSAIVGASVVPAVCERPSYNAEA